VSYDPSASTPIPADIERPDKILAGLTARQVAILTTATVIIWAGFEATHRLVALPVFAVLAAPVAVAAAALVIGHRDGLSLDRLLIAAWCHARSPRRLVTAPGGIPAPPAWVSQRLARQQGGPPAPLESLYRAVASDGVIGLGDGGCAVAAAVSTVNLALRTPAEQDALTAAFGRWLNSRHRPRADPHPGRPRRPVRGGRHAGRHRPRAARPGPRGRRPRSRRVPRRTRRQPGPAHPPGPPYHPRTPPHRPQRRPRRRWRATRSAARRRGGAAARRGGADGQRAGRRSGHRPPRGRS
jgi:hypothetical protein